MEKSKEDLTPQSSLEYQMEWLERILEKLDKGTDLFEMTERKLNIIKLRLKLKGKI